MSNQKPSQSKQNPTKEELLRTLVDELLKDRRFARRIGDALDIIHFSGVIEYFDRKAGCPYKPGGEAVVPRLGGNVAARKLAKHVRYGIHIDFEHRTSLPVLAEQRSELISNRPCTLRSVGQASSEEMER